LCWGTPDYTGFLSDLRIIMANNSTSQSEQYRPHPILRLVCVLIAIFQLTACSAPAAAPASAVISINIAADGKEQKIQVPAGTSVQMALVKAGLTLNSLDRADPNSSTQLSGPTTIRVIRVREEFEVKENTIAYERQTVRNEMLPQGQTMLIQKGANGQQQVTYRRVLEDGVEVSNGIFKTTTLTEARPEIIMVGVQTPFTSLTIPGRLAYLTAGNAWVIEKATGNRKPVITTGDLDGRVFSLSKDGEWLLFTRKAQSGEKDTINSLWVVRVGVDKPVPIDLKVKNIVHFASWVPGSGLTLVYSTVEPRSAPPGWQANNDLQQLSITTGGAVLQKKEIVKTNSGGIYGWWGSTFAWSSDGSRLAYARPDSVGLVDLTKGTFVSLLDVLPLQTRSDWAWVPSLSWSPDGRILFTVNHAILAGMNSPEESPLFDLTALAVQAGPSVSIAPQAGMFSYPAASPLDADIRYSVAYLQAIFPEQSETSNYRLVLMDRDGSNRQILFPPEGSSGMEPQQVVWSPPGFENKNAWIGMIYQGNLWFLDPQTRQAQQVTGDGSIIRIDWK
jgi:resuscitation-promoting factor RpfB